MTPDPGLLEDALREVRYPCGRRQLVEHAAAQGAGDEILGHLGSLPERSYDCLGTVRARLAECFPR